MSVQGRNGHGSHEQSHQAEVEFAALVQQWKGVLEYNTRMIANLIQAIKRDPEKQAVILQPNTDVQLNFSAMSVYVDNSGNANEITLQPEGYPGVFTVAANTQEWIYPLGTKVFRVSGTVSGQSVAMFTTAIVK